MIGLANNEFDNIKLLNNLQFFQIYKAIQSYGEKTYNYRKLYKLEKTRISLGTKTKKGSSWYIKLVLCIGSGKTGKNQTISVRSLICLSEIDSFLSSNL